jgi:hypothetical protein
MKPPPTNPRPREPERPVRRQRIRLPTVSDLENHPDRVQRIPSGGGYRILRRPRLLDCED